MNYVGADLVLSADAISFLRNNGMDFGKWMSSGLSFADSRRFEWLQKRLTDSLAVKSSIDDGKGMVLTRESDLAFGKRNIDGLENFIENTELTEYVFEDTNSYLRRYLYDTVERRFPQLTMKKNSEGKLCALKLDLAQSNEHKENVEREARERFETDAGFRLVFDDLVAAKKPLIGHNLCFDLLFMLRWLDGPLPQTFSELKDHLHGMFPTVYDTKYLAASGIMGDAFTSMSTSLSDVYKRFVGDISDGAVAAGGESEMVGGDANVAPTVVACPIQTAVGFPDFLNPSSEDAKQFHNAGYDAFCTGCVFARQSSTLDSITPVSLSPDDEGMEAVVWRTSANNMLFMMRSLYHMSLTPGNIDGLIKVKGIIFNVSGFAKYTKTDDVLTVFSTALGSESVGIDVIWVDDNSLFVVISSAVANKFCLDHGHLDVAISSDGGLSDENASLALTTSIEEQLEVVCERERAATMSVVSPVPEGSEKTTTDVEVVPWRVEFYSTYLAEKLDLETKIKRSAEEVDESGCDNVTPRRSKRAKVV